MLQTIQMQHICSATWSVKHMSLSLRRSLSWTLLGREQSEFKELSVHAPPCSQIVEHSFARATVLFIDIQSFTASCNLLGVEKTGTWVQTFYDIVSDQCAIHDALMVEHRGDCCVCATRGPRQATHMLALCCDLHARLHPTHTVRMGVSTGAVNFLKGPQLLCIYGPVSQVAEALQALTVPGVVLVHWPTVVQWRSESPLQRMAGMTRLVRLPQKEAVQVADFQLQCGAFATRRSLSWS